MTTPTSLEHQHTLATAVARYDHLRMRDLLAPVAPDRDAEEIPPGTPLSQQEALELLALGEAIARKAAYGRQLTVRAARAAGASWSQIGAALGTTKQAAWDSHNRWIEDQLRQGGQEALNGPRAVADREVDADGEDLPG
jgi:hypothetical protein